MEETGKVRGRQADAVTIVLCTAGVWAAAQPAPRRAEGGQGPPQVCADSLSFPRNKPNAVTLTLGDVERLDPGQFLNDSLIDFW